MFTFDEDNTNQRLVVFNINITFNITTYYYYL